MASQDAPLRIGKRIAVACLLTLVCLQFAAAQTAAPPIPAENFNAPALAAMLPEAAAVHAAAVKDLQEAQQGLAAIINAHQKGEAAFARLAPTVFTQTRAAILGLRWEAPWLAQFGEPAGVELDRRSRIMNSLWKRFASIYRASPKGAAFNQKAVATYLRNVKMREAAYQRAAKLVEQGKLEAAETYVLKTIRTWIAKDLGLMDSYVQYVGGFQPSINAFREPLAQARQQTAATGFAKLRNQAMPQTDAVAAAQERIAAVRDGQSAAPDAFDQTSRDWKVAHWQLGRAESAELARLGLLQQATSPELEAIQQRHQLLTSGMSEALANLASVAAAKPSDSELQRMLAAGANLHSNARPQTLTKLDQALLDYAAKLHGDEVRSLHAALAELLTWRQRAAEARAANYVSNGYQDARSAVIDAGKSTAQLKGMFPTDGRPGPMFDGSVPEIITLASAEGKKVAVRSVAASATSGGVRRTELDERVFATLPIRWDVEPQLVELKNDLLISEETPAITPAAAAAVASARAGVFERVGGVVDGIVCRSLLETRHALPAASWNMLPLGPLPAAPPQPFTPQAAIQIRLRPEWVQHRHFVAPAAAANTPPRS